MGCEYAKGSFGGTGTLVLVFSCRASGRVYELQNLEEQAIKLIGRYTSIKCMRHKAERVRWIDALKMDYNNFDSGWACIG